MKVRSRVILPSIYLIIGGYFSGQCFLHLGHWSGCEYARYSCMPAVLLIPESVPFGFAWAFLAGLFQYALLGYLLDWLVGKVLGCTFVIKDR